MKVWNMDIPTCVQCPYIFVDEYNCANCGSTGRVGFYLGKDYEIEDIHKDCPFNKSITKEVIESFGFKVVKEQGNAYKGIIEYNYEYEDSNLIGYWTIIKSSDNYCVIQKEDYIGVMCYFRGAINNPEELKFILASLGIIE